MKRAIRLIATILCIVALSAGLFTAYAAAKNNESAKGPTDPPEGYYNFAFTLPYGGLLKKGTSHQKVVAGSAQFIVYSYTNSTGYYSYVNVRSSDGSTIKGTAHNIHPGSTPSFSFPVDYLIINGVYQGIINMYYCPSAQASSSSIAGSVYISGVWRP